MPPADLPGNAYQRYIGLLPKILAELDVIEADAVIGAAGKPMFFRMGDTEISFTSENFVMSFSLPNLYFHATILYVMLCNKGVPVGKMDFQGQKSVGLPEA